MDSPRGARGWLKRVKKSDQQLFYVYQIAEYLCRYKNSKLDDTKFTIEYAKLFVEKKTQTLTRRTLSKYWEENKRAAPYIFAFYHFYSSTIAGAASIDQFVEALEQLCETQQHLIKLLGEAAHTADVLAGKARRVRQADFREVKRVEPQLAAFNADEMQIINAIDTAQLSEKDTQDYKPKAIAR